MLVGLYREPVKLGVRERMENCKIYMQTKNYKQIIKRLSNTSIKIK